MKKIKISSFKWQAEIFQDKVRFLGRTKEWGQLSVKCTSNRFVQCISIQTLLTIWNGKGLNLAFYISDNNIVVNWLNGALWDALSWTCRIALIALCAYLGTFSNQISPQFYYRESSGYNSIWRFACTMLTPIKIKTYVFWLVLIASYLWVIKSACMQGKNCRRHPDVL